MHHEGMLMPAFCREMSGANVRSGIGRSHRKERTRYPAIRGRVIRGWIQYVSLLSDAVLGVRQRANGIALAIDLTGRNVQDAVKKKGLPWSTAKGFDTFCPIGYVQAFHSLVRLQLTGWTDRSSQNQRLRA